jgi:hypothetical protein
MIDEDMEHITKEWPKEFHVPVDDVKISNPHIIGIPLVTRFEHAGQSSARRKIKRRKFRT